MNRTISASSRRSKTRAEAFDKCGSTPAWQSNATTSRHLQTKVSDPSARNTCRDHYLGFQSLLRMIKLCRQERGSMKPKMINSRLMIVFGLRNVWLQPSFGDKEIFLLVNQDFPMEPSKSVLSKKSLSDASDVAPTLSRFFRKKCKRS